MDSYQEKCPKPIPIGVQKFAYQCEDLTLEPLFGTINIRGYIPFKGGKEPYPNLEKDIIAHYDLKIGRFTSNALEITFVKRFKDAGEEIYSVTVSFSDLVNRIFGNNPANVWKREPPVIPFDGSQTDKK